MNGIELQQRTPQEIADSLLAGFQGGQAAPPAPERSPEDIAQRLLAGPTIIPKEKSYGLPYIVGETLKGTWQDIKKSGVNLVKSLFSTPISVIGNLYQQGKQAIEHPEEIPSLPTQLQAALSPESQKLFMEGGGEGLKGLALFVPMGIKNFATNPRKAIVEDPLGTFMSLSIGVGMATKGGAVLWEKVRSKTPVSGADVIRTVESAPRDVIPPESKAKIISEIKPDEILYMEPKIGPQRTPVEIADSLLAGKKPEIAPEIAKPAPSIALESSRTGDLVPPLPTTRAKPVAAPETEITAPGTEIRIKQNVEGETVITIPAKPKPEPIKPKEVDLELPLDLNLELVRERGTMEPVVSPLGDIRKQQPLFGKKESTKILKTLSGEEVRLPTASTHHWPAVIPDAWAEVMKITEGRGIAPEMPGKNIEWSEMIPRELKRKGGVALDEVLSRMSRERMKGQEMVYEDLRDMSDKILREIEASKGKGKTKGEASYEEQVESEAMREEAETMAAKPRELTEQQKQELTIAVRKNLDPKIQGAVYEDAARNWNPEVSPAENFVRNRRKYYDEEYGELRTRAFKKKTELEKQPPESALEGEPIFVEETKAKHKPPAEPIAERPEVEAEAVREARIAKANSIIKKHATSPEKAERDLDIVKSMTARDISGETVIEIGNRHGLSESAVKLINTTIKEKLANDPEARAFYNEELIYKHAGIPVTDEVRAAIKKVKEKIKEKRDVKLEEIKSELQKTDEGKVEWMYIETDKQFKDKRSPTVRGAVEAAKRAMVDTSGNIKRKLLKESGSLGKEAVMNHDLIAGASAKTETLFNEASKRIYADLTKDQEVLLNRAIQSRRTVAVSKYKPEIKHPLGLTTKEHEAYLKTIPKEINDRADLYFKEMEKVRDDLKAEGLINEEQYQALKKSGDYSPRWFLSHIDPESTYVISGKTITVPDSGIKALDEGSYGVMETNSRALLSNVIGRTQARIFRNRAAKSAYKIADELPDNGIFKKAEVIKETKEGKPVYQPVPTGHTKIKAMIDGEAKEIIMPDKYAKEWVMRDPLISEQLSNIIGWLSGSRILKPMATGLNPEFALTNMPRDIAHVWLTTPEYSSFLPKGAAQFARDFVVTAKDAFTRKGRWREFIDQGGGMSFLTHQGRISEGAGGILKGFQDVMGYLGETSEAWTRLALRERALLNGKSPTEATWIARNYLDFSQGGNVAKAIDSAIPYFNASIQGTRGIFRAIGDRPVDTIFKFAQVGTLASGLYLANRFANKETWDHVTDREKVNNFIITTPFSYKDDKGNTRYLYFKVAKDQGQRVLCSIFESLMAKSLGEDVNADQITQGIQDFLPLVPTDSLPPSMEAMLGYFANKDFWLNKDIWRGPKVTPREEYTTYTHPALVEVGKITGLSPERLDFSLSQFFTKGNIYTSLVSGGLSLAMKDLPEGEKIKVNTEMVQGLPFIRRSFRSTPPYSEKELKEESRAQVEESTRRYKQTRDLDELSKKYYQKKNQNTLDEIKSFIKEQPLADEKRLIDRFKKYGKIYDIPDRSWWLNLAGTPPEARANIFWTKYARSNESEKEELIKLAKRVPGVWSDPFIKRLRILISKNKEE